MTPFSPGNLAQVACLLEATARKPGNVHRFRDFDDAHYLDFLLSASALVKPLDRARSDGVGVAILAAVEATRRIVSNNTNLGMILLLAPLAAVPEGVPLRSGVADVLARLTARDASLTYQAIRLARPGGLGTVENQDVAEEPSVTLLEAMTLAAGRDMVAAQYANSYEQVFDNAYSSLRDGVEAGWSIERAIVFSYMCLMTLFLDTLILRKRGAEVAREASSWARRVLMNGWPEKADGIRMYHDFDAWLRGDGHARNPGATADLVTAALFVALRDGTIPLPIAQFEDR